MTWQPIKTAPKDGTPILAYITASDWDVGEDCSSPRSTDRPYIAGVYFGTGEWWLVQDFEQAVTAHPTHWMPLPEPPSD